MCPYSVYHRGVKERGKIFPIRGRKSSLYEDWLMEQQRRRGDKYECASVILLHILTFDIGRPGFQKWGVGPFYFRMKRFVIFL